LAGTLDQFEAGDSAAVARASPILFPRASRSASRFAWPIRLETPARAV
jgi:hypothetical protein